MGSEPDMCRQNGAIDGEDGTDLDIEAVLSDVRRALDDLVATPRPGDELTGPLPSDMRSVLESLQERHVRELAAHRGVTSALESMVAEIERRVLPDLPAAGLAPLDGADGLAASTANAILLLRDAMQQNPPRIEPELDPTAPLGHAYPFASERLEMDAAEVVVALEELADLGLLQRTLANRVHLCPSCEHVQINFRETCTRCESIDLSIERVLHHFRCGYIGIESEFRSGRDLVCPKCRHELHQLGQDFDRPHETYVCHDCSTLMEEPKLVGQCLSCGHEFDSHKALTRAVHTYVPTPLAVRAVELGRLTGLDVDSILYDAELKIATRDFLEFEIKRELLRLDRGGSVFTTATLGFERAGRPVPIFREWTAGALRDLCATLAESLRVLDLVTRLDTERLGILMPGADEQGTEAVRRRLFDFLAGIDLIDPGGNEFVPVWRAVTWRGPGAGIAAVQEFLRPVDP